MFGCYCCCYCCCQGVYRAYRCEQGRQARGHLRQQPGEGQHVRSVAPGTQATLLPHVVVAFNPAQPVHAAGCRRSNHTRGRGTAVAASGDASAAVSFAVRSSARLRRDPVAGPTQPAYLSEWRRKGVFIVDGGRRRPFQCVINRRVPTVRTCEGTNQSPFYL